MKTQKTRRILAVLLALVLTLGLLPTSAFAARIVPDEVQITAPEGGSSEKGGDSPADFNWAGGSHSYSVRFKVLYVDSSFNIGYNYGSEYTTNVNCQYNNCSTTGAYSNHCIAISDIGEARSYVSVNSGYKIVGWTKSASANPTINTKWTGTGYGSGGTTLQKGGTIYLVAKRESSRYTISYNANSGSGAPSATYTETNTSATKSGTLSSGKPTRSGYTFLGWSTNSGATTASYAAGGTYNFTSNTTLYAVWQKNQATLTYHGNYNDIGTVPTAVTVNKGSSVTIKDRGTMDRSTHNFRGWSTTQGSQTVDYEPGETMTLTADTTLYAVWSQYQSKLMYHSNDGQNKSGGGSSKSLKGNAHSYTLYAITNGSFTSWGQGKTFLGWNTKADGTGTTYGAGDEVSVTATSFDSNNPTVLDLYAMWQSNTATADYTVQWFDTLGNKLKADETRNGTVDETVSASSEDKSINGFQYVKNQNSVESATVNSDGTTALKLYFIPVVEYPGQSLCVASKCQDHAHHGSHWQGDYPETGAVEMSQALIGTAEDGTGYYYFRITLKKTYWENYFINESPYAFSKRYPSITHTIVTENDIPVLFKWDVENQEWVQQGEDPTFIFEGNDITYVWKDASGNQIETVEQSACIDPPAFPGANLPQKPEDDDNTYDFDKWSDPKDEDGKVVYEPEYTPTAKPKLTVEKLALVNGNVKPGDTVKYQITVTNVGTTDVKNVVITDVLDSNLEFVEAAGTGEYWNKDSKPANGKYEFGEYTLNPGTNHSTITLTITAKVAANAPDGIIPNVASADCPNMPADKPSDNANITVESHTHNYQPADPEHPEWAAGKAPTCTADGTQVLRCSCGDTKEEVVTGSALGHDFENAAWVDDNRAGEHYDGCNTAQHRQVCNRCHGDLEGGVNRASHTYGEWVVDHAASLTETGLRHRDCADCDHVQTDVIPTLDKVTITIKYVDEEGNEVGTKDVDVPKGSEYDVTDEIEIPEGYEKNGEPENATGTADGDKTVTVPVKKPEEPGKELTVKWVSEDGNTVLDEKKFKEGEEEPAKTIEDPAKAEDATYTYTFDKWIKSTDAEGNVTYTASYTSTRKNNGGNGGGGGGGNRPVNPPEEDLDDPDVPLANLPMLNQDDHFAYIIGKPDGNVYPLGNITRAEVVTIFFRIMTEEARSENWGETNEFSDVAAGVWYNHAVCTAVNAGLIKGLPDGTFGGDKNITRAEFATIAARFLDTVSQPAETFSDIEGHWAEADINRATVAGWIKGVGDGKFNPDAYITRAEVMTLVNRMLNRKFDENNTLADMVVWPDNMDKNAWYYGDVQEATNDHDYDRKAGTLTETWTKITESRDWSELEK